MLIRLLSLEYTAEGHNQQGRALIHLLAPLNELLLIQIGLCILFEFYKLAYLPSYSWVHRLLGLAPRPSWY